MSVNAHAFCEPSPAAGTLPSPIARPAWVVVVLVIFLSTALVLAGVAPSAAVATVSGAGLAAAEVLRRLIRVCAVRP